MVKCGEEARFLDDVADATAEANGIGFGGGATFDENLALRRDEHAIYEFEQRSFAAAAAAQEDESFAARDAKGNA